jgi:hypothetical protein
MHPFLRLSLILTLTGFAALAADPIDIGSRRELFVDRLLIDKMDGSELRLHAPQPVGTAVKFDQPWEGRFSAYITVLHDEKLKKYRMYYRGNAGFADGTAGEVTCYAESDDGIRWEKPNLGLHEVNGTKDNNVILANQPPYTHNFAPFLDKRPGVPENERYKTLAGLGGKFGGLAAFVSGDGIHWRKLREEAVITKGAFDSQNVSFWSETEKCYVAYFRIFTPGSEKDPKSGKPRNVRWVSRATSQDFITWSDAVQMASDRPLEDQIYVSQTTPYFNAPHLYVATAARFMQAKNDLDDTAKKYLEQDAAAYASLTKDTSEAVLMTSRAGTTEYKRTFMESFVRPGLHFRNWTSRTNYPACGILRTGTSEMSLFIERHYGQSTALLQRCKLRLDGFASLHAGYEGGEMVTKPLTFSGAHLHLNFSTGVSGEVAVEIQKPDGQPIPGFTMDECNGIAYDDIDRILTWKSGADLAALAGQPVRLRWRLRDADVFAFWFQ